MSFLPDLFNKDRGLSNPGDKLFAEVTQSGRQVIKIFSKKTKRSFVRYPGTETIVETIVHKKK